MKNVEDIYPLSPMQQMMLLHAHTHAGQDVLFNQVCYRLSGKLGEKAFVEAWCQVVSRHAALRSLFLFEGLPRPMQVVRQQVELPFSSVDWRDRSADEKAALLKRLRNDDRACAFNPEQAPMMRLTLARAEDEAYYLLWSSHHLVLDRWCNAIVMHDVAEAYGAVLAGTTTALPPARSYREYIRWIESRDTERTSNFWCAQMSGYRGDSSLTHRNKQIDSVNVTRVLQAEDHDAVSRFCRTNHLTIATLVQAAWSLLINRHGGEQDVVFGVVCSGRPPDVPEVESIVGSFITNLPVRAKLAADAPVGSWLSSLQLQSQQRLPHEYVSLGQIRSWCELAPSQTMFDSLIVWLAEIKEDDLPGLQTEVLTHTIGTAYPLTLYIDERDDGMRLTLEVGAGSSPAAPAEELLADFYAILLELASSNAEQHLGSLAGFRGVLSAEDLFEVEQPQRSARLQTTPAADRKASIKGRETPEPRLLEELVAAQWHAVLGLEHIQRDTDFFSAGGDSLLATSLADSLQTALRMEIPMLSLFREPTITAMTRLILQEDWPVTAQVATQIKENGTLTPLFCVASPEVETVGYAVLARHLSQERPAYVLQSPPSGNAVRRLYPTEIPELAKTYVDAMREIQPAGPYNLLGMCTGAQIEIEICRLLESQGEAIAFSGIVDTWALHTLSRGIYLKKALNTAGYYLRLLRQLRPARNKQPKISAQDAENARVQSPAEIAEQPTDNAAADAEGQRSYSIIEEVGWPRDVPDLPKINSSITVFKQKNRPQYWRIRDPSLGWGLHAQSINLVKLGAPAHKDIFREPWVHELASYVDKRLAAAPTGAAGDHHIIR